MPAADRSDAVAGGDFTEEKSAPDVAEERDHRAGDDEQHALRKSHPIKRPEKKRDHECRLERADAGAGVIDSDLAGAELDHISVLHRERADEIQQPDRDRGVGAHQMLDDELLELHRPGHGDEEEQNRESEVTQRRRAAGQMQRA